MQTNILMSTSYMMKKNILITGATSGIGKAVSERFAKEKHHNIIITGRRNDRLIALKETLESKYAANVLTLCFDIRELQEVKKAIQSIPESFLPINILVNNAGLAVGLNPIQEGLIEDWERMIDTNVKGMLYISREILPFMVKDGQGHVINIGSTAGKEVYPGGNVYCGTKHAVDAISKGMRIDLLKHNIKVTQIRPGMVDTEFSLVRFKGDQQKADDVYQNMTPLMAEDVAEVTYYTATLPPHVTINDLELTCTNQANSYLVNRSN